MALFMEKLGVGDKNNRWKLFPRSIATAGVI